MGDTQYHFRMKLCPSRRKSISTFKEYNDQCLVSLEAETEFFYGYVYFRQIKDKSAKRGYFQKSLVLISKLPFVSLFKTVVSLVANDFFDHGSEVIEEACKEIDTWAKPTPGSSLSLPIMGTIIQVRVPHRTETLTGSIKGAISPTSSSIDTVLGLDPNPVRNGSLGLAQSPSKTSITRLASLSNNHATQSIAIPCLYEQNLFKCFFPVMSNLQELWELVLTCEPLIVMAPTPDITCEVVQALVACIWPLKYASDFRPFFTIHDPEFKDFTSTAFAPPPVLLGVTNPFFAKALQHWPHIIRIGEYTSMSPQKTKKGFLKSFDCTPGVHTKAKPFLTKDRVIIKKLLQGIDSQRPSEVQSALIRRYFLELTQSFLIPLERYLASLMPLQKNVSPFKSTPVIEPFNPDEFFKVIEITGPNLTSGIKGDWIGLYKKFFRCPNFKLWYETRCQEVNEQLNQVHIKAILDADLKSWVRNKSEVEVIDLVLTLKEKIKSLRINDHEQTRPSTSSPSKSGRYQRNPSPDTRNDPESTLKKLTSLVREIVKVLPPDLHPILNRKP